jgi:hypothetical protein
MDIPDAAPKLFDALEAARDDINLDSSIRQQLIDDLLIALSAFPSLPPGATRYSRTSLKNMLPSVDEREAAPVIQQALSKIKRIFTESQRMHSTLRIASSH